MTPEPETARCRSEPANAGRRTSRTMRDAWIAAGIIAVTAVGGGMMTVWEPCFDDAGELQIASAVLGIAHAPGYPGYVMLGHLICLLPGIEPAALISGANLAAGVFSLALCYLIQRRLGVHALAAVFIVAAVALHDRYWTAITVPEVYAPSLLVVCSAAYAALRWAQGDSNTWLTCSSALLGFLVINRPSELLLVPAFAILVVVAGRRRFGGMRAVMRRVPGLVLVALIPMAICTGYVLWRDSPDTPYNALETYHQRIGTIPSAGGGEPTRWERWYWMVSGQAHRVWLVDSLHKFAVRLEYLREEFGYAGPVGFCVGLGVVLLGVIALFRRNVPQSVFIVAVILGNAAFYCLYVAYGSETFILPALVFVGCLGGLGLTRLFEQARFRPAPVLAVLCLGAACVYHSSDDDWLQTDDYLDGRSFLEQADVGSLPAGSVIMGLYHRVKPAEYEVLVRLKRKDMDVLVASQERFAREVVKCADRPIYFVDVHPVPDGYTLVPQRNLYRVMGHEPRASAAAEARLGLQ